MFVTVLVTVYVGVFVTVSVTVSVNVAVNAQSSGISSKEYRAAALFPPVIEIVSLVLLFITKLSAINIVLPEVAIPFLAVPLVTVGKVPFEYPKIPI